MLRLPDGMRDRIAEAAKANGRSMNAEIISRLETSFADPHTAPTPDKTLFVVLDPQGHPISWSEVMAHIGAITKGGKLDPQSIQAVVISDKMASNATRETQWLDLIKWYREQPKRKG